MLINLRNALMTGKRLPYDAEVEYLESTGTQFIDTLVNADSNLSVEITMANAGTPWTNVNPTGVILATPRCRHHLNFNSSLYSNGVNYYFGNGDNCIVQSRYMPADGEIFTFKVDAISKTFTLGSFLGTFPNDTFDTGLSYWLFGRNGTTPPYLGSLRIYSAKLWNGSTLVRDFIPVRKGMVGYLYDRVTRKLFGNAGTGNFVLGSDVVPVEYIESRSNHAQIIDTGFYANQNTKSLITFEKLGNDGWLFGSRNGSSSATDKFGIFAYQSPDGKISAQVGSAYIEPIISGSLTNRKRTIEMSLADGVIVDGETIAAFPESQKSQTFTSTYPIALFNLRTSSSGFNSGIYCRVYAYQIFENGLVARSFRPVRVGTEGAMMDVLTRRIYRNAGTGAFGYGNDLKYPIPAE